MKIINLNESRAEDLGYAKYADTKSVIDPHLDPREPGYIIDLRPEEDYLAQKSKLPANCRLGLDNFRDDNPRVKTAVIVLKKDSSKIDEIDEGLICEDVEEESDNEKKKRVIDIHKSLNPDAKELVTFRTLQEIIDGVTFSDILRDPNTVLVDSSKDDADDGDDDIDDIDDDVDGSVGDEGPDYHDDIEKVEFSLDNDYDNASDYSSIPDTEAGIDDDDDYMEPQYDEAPLTQEEKDLLKSAEEDEEQEVEVLPIED